MSRDNKSRGEALAPEVRARPQHQTVLFPYTAQGPAHSTLPALPTGASTSLVTPALPMLAAASPPQQSFPFPNQLTRILRSLHRHCTASATWGSFSVITGSARDAQKHAWRHNPDGKRDPRKSQPSDPTDHQSEPEHQADLGLPRIQPSCQLPAVTAETGPFPRGRSGLRRGNPALY